MSSSLKARLLILAGILIFCALVVTTADASNYYKPRYHHPKPCYWNCGPVIPPLVVVPNPPVAHPFGVCTSGPGIGKLAIAGTDGHVPASGNTNDKCDWSAPARVPHPAYPNG